MTTQQESIAAYEGVRTRFSGLVTASPDRLGTVVPAAPDWRIHDLLAHVVGITADLVAGNMHGVGSDPWTAAQVDQRKDRTVDELLAEWVENWPAFTAALGSLDEFHAAQVVFDVVTHEHDLRGALGEAGARDSDAFGIAWGWSVNVLGLIRDGKGLGAIELITEAGTEVAGTAAVTSTVRAGRFELFRAMTGRRSVEQVQAWNWEGEPAADQLAFLPARPTALVE